ncbi:MAG: DUF2892 domain-containing protein [Balneolaceae bacterium]|nr:DUF2892 domain-containing protein [Balneolaceae bacterium]
MKNNTGFIDRTIRTLLGIFILAAGVYFENLWGVVGVIPLISGLSGFCPLYAVFDLSTCEPARVDRARR